jgi:hypothetical protein
LKEFVGRCDAILIFILGYKYEKTFLIPFEFPGVKSVVRTQT